MKIEMKCRSCGVDGILKLIKTHGVVIIYCEKCKSVYFFDDIDKS